jgi:tetratricopeptide (TPR) repeat protein
MEENTNTLRENIEELYKLSKFEEIIALLSDEVLVKQKDAELYAWRSITNYKLDYDIAVTMFFAEKAIDADPTNFMGYFARACAWDGKKENDKAIIDYTKAIKINPKNEELYIRKGTTCYFKKDFNQAIADFNQAIEIKPNYELAFYNRGLAYIAKGEYASAIKDCDKVIKFNPNYIEAYISRGRIRRFLEEYNLAIEDFNEAIKRDSLNANAYYNRGLAYYNKALNEKEINIDILIKSKENFKNFIKFTPDKKDIELTPDKKDNGAKYAKQCVEELKVVIEDPNLWFIKQLINNIKDTLWIRKESCITHYTSLTALKDLIFDDSKFGISEGNFMNDPSEGLEFFKFLEYKPDTFRKTNPSTESVSPKPFIGSFVNNAKCDNLNMWRFYGKEKGEEAKGCSITLHKQKFIDDINDSLSSEKNKEARLDDESDINFYRVAYVVNNGSIKFNIPNSDKREKLDGLMKELKTKVESYKGDNKAFLEKYLNSIAFLFKNDAYKNEDEVRLVMNGLEFPKKYKMGINSPRVYIELVSIKDIVSHIILGPKVDNGNEWIAAFNYRYGEKTPKIEFSHLPYK